MSFQKSTPEEIAACAALVSRTEQEIERLVAEGKKVHLIWDVDHVLVSGRSDDVFAALGYDVPKYFAFEERLAFECMSDGPWARLARRCGEKTRHQSQDIVTARSSFLSLRVMMWLLMNGYIDIRWQLFVGHQSKAESYRIILKSFERDPDVHVFMVDDGAKHVEAFKQVAAELGMSDRTVGILSPQIRQYDEAEIKREAEAVLGYAGDKPAFITVRDRVLGEDNGRYLTVTPDPFQSIRRALLSEHMDLHKEATVEQHRKTLEAFSDDVTPGQPKTVEHLFFLHELLRSPG